MKHTLLATAIAVGVSIFSFNVNASNNHTISLGYAQSSINSDAEIQLANKKMDNKQHGLNLKYRYEFDKHFGIISSLTYTQNQHTDDNLGNISKFKWSNTSLMAGPAYRFNDFVSAYGLLGAVHRKVSFDVSDKTTNGSMKKTSLSYGIGLQFNPAPNWAADVSYSHAKSGEFKLGTWAFGVGYRF
ncbi:attachment invasion locus protein [Xenorhabdus mauleonii]|uniref:Attachment invasion locus protein n=1 Tax=Xenorhabdus mauleonii TaxID=351675 RepID=A0A1I3IX74_9GAMM|nr:Ail/Lom family outer membrane beta-barrel protein [Xenorhabdus mauleonii]PHM46022.1 attachment invasion locus protein [Xenorhabdus mauleonii]SFI52455.1 attachment invasion locus protein [Xenorhabdus mauleonii]